MITAQAGCILHSTHPGFLDGAINTKMERGRCDPRQINNGIEGLLLFYLFFVLSLALIVVPVGYITLAAYYHSDSSNRHTLYAGLYK